MENHPIRVLLVDPSSFALQKLEKMLASAPEIAVVGRVQSGAAALELVASLKPAVMCVSPVLPGLSGLELMQQVMRHHPCAILALDSDAPTAGSLTAAALIEAGAVDVWCKPGTLEPIDAPASLELIAKIKRLSRVPIISRTRPSQGQGADASSSCVPDLATAARVSAGDAESSALVGVVALGASTGGPQVFLEILSALPRNFPFPVLCVQHISKGFGLELVDWLAGQCAIAVKVACPGEKAEAGQVYFAPDDQHLELDVGNRLRLSSAPRRDGHRPSVTLLFESLARHAGNRGVAVLLTGMGSDGATGLQSAFQAGAVTIAQNEASCVVFGMPFQAIQLGAAQSILPPAEIASRLLSLAARAKKNR